MSATTSTKMLPDTMSTVSWKLMFAIGLFFMEVSPTMSQATATNETNNYYYQAGPCPFEPTLIGYSNLTAMNEDILSHFEDSLQFGRSDIKYKYIICPQATYEIENMGQTIIPATDETTFSCGEDGSLENNCLIIGGQFQIYFLDRLALENIVFKGFKFQEAQAYSVYGDAHPSSLVTFRDCDWKYLDTVDAIYIHFTPYYASRRLTEKTKKYEFERPAVIKKYEAVLEKYEDVYKQKKGRLLQINRRYSMAVIFDRCNFAHITNRDSVIFNVGGEVGVFNSTFQYNEVEKYGLFTTILNGHAYLAGKESEAIGNDAPFGTLFVSSDSYLQYSEGASGSYNVGKFCTSIFIEDVGASCMFENENSTCTGNCCAFDDVTCDYSPEKTDIPTPVSTTSPTSGPTPVPTPSPVKAIKNSYLEESSEEGGGDGSESSEAGDQDSMNSIVQDVSEVNSGDKASKFYRQAFVIVLPLLLLVVVIIVYILCCKRSARKNKGDVSTAKAQAPEFVAEKTVEIS